MTLTAKTKRIHETRQKLEQLSQMGYKYVATQDDGETWVGHQQTGLEIELLINHGFLGNVLIGR